MYSKIGTNNARKDMVVLHPVCIATRRMGRMPAKEMLVALLLQMVYKLESFPLAKAAPMTVILVSIRNLAAH
jgi:hypothetical protein